MKRIKEKFWSLNLNLLKRIPTRAQLLNLFPESVLERRRLNLLVEYAELVDNREVKVAAPPGQNLFYITSLISEDIFYIVQVNSTGSFARVYKNSRFDMEGLTELEQALLKKAETRYFFTKPIYLQSELDREEEAEISFELDSELVDSEKEEDLLN